MRVLLPGRVVGAVCSGLPGLASFGHAPGKEKGACMADKQPVAPESSAVRVALWRAMHVQVDSPPHVLEDEIGLQLAAPGGGWRERPDMDVQGTRLFRA